MSLHASKLHGTSVDRRQVPILCLDAGTEFLMSNPCVADEFASGARRVELILSDVDGTLLDHSQTLTPGVKAAVEAASAAGVPLILATGKALGPWVGPVLEALPLPLPRIHMQGLHIVDPKEGVIFDRTLDEAIFHDTLAFCREHGAAGRAVRFPYLLGEQGAWVAGSSVAGPPQCRLGMARVPCGGQGQCVYSPLSIVKELPGAISAEPGTVAPNLHHRTHQASR